MRVCLLRVGIDTGSGGMLGPLLGRDGRYEYVSIPHEDPKGKTYGEILGKMTGRPLVEFFPQRRQAEMAGTVAHYDPEFDSFTYGDPTRLKRSLRNLKPRDILAFYGGFEPYGFDDASLRGLYLFAYFEVEDAGEYEDEAHKKLRRLCSENFHVKNVEDNEGLILVKGSADSRLLDRAHLISQNDRDSGGHRIYVLSEEAKKHVGTFTKLNAIQRSAPRWVSEDMTEKAAAWIRGLD